MAVMATATRVGRPRNVVMKSRATNAARHCRACPRRATRSDAEGSIARGACVGPLPPRDGADERTVLGSRDDPDPARAPPLEFLRRLLDQRPGRRHRPLVGSFPVRSARGLFLARRHDPRAPGDRVRGDHDAGGRPPSAPFALTPELDRRRQDLPDDLIASRQRAAGGASGCEEGEDRNTESEPHASPF